MQDQSIDFNKIKELREELNKLLEERPEYRKLQDEIDEALRKAGSNKLNRNVVIQQMMLNSMKELQKNMVQLMETIKKREE